MGAMSEIEYTLPQLLDRLETFGAYVMDDSGATTDFQPNALAEASHYYLLKQASMIEMLSQVGDQLVELVLSALGPLSTDADEAEVARFRQFRNSDAMTQWANLQRSRRG